MRYRDTGIESAQEKNTEEPRSDNKDIKRSKEAHSVH